MSYNRNIASAYDAIEKAKTEFDPKRYGSMRATATRSRIEVIEGLLEISKGE